jgi:hypothetical protein
MIDTIGVSTSPTRRTLIHKPTNNYPSMTRSLAAVILAPGLNQAEPAVGLQRKRAVYGLNGHRANFVIDLSLGGYGHAI